MHHYVRVHADQSRDGGCSRLSSLSIQTTAVVGERTSSALLHPILSPRSPQEQGRRVKQRWPQHPGTSLVHLQLHLTALQNKRMSSRGWTQSELLIGLGSGAWAKTRFDMTFLVLVYGICILCFALSLSRGEYSWPLL